MRKSQPLYWSCLMTKKSAQRQYELRDQGEIGRGKEDVLEDQRQHRGPGTAVPRQPLLRVRQAMVINQEKREAGRSFIRIWI